MKSMAWTDSGIRAEGKARGKDGQPAVTSVTGPCDGHHTERTLRTNYVLKPARGNPYGVCRELHRQFRSRRGGGRGGEPHHPLPWMPPSTTVDPWRRLIQTGIDQKSAPVPEVSTPLQVTTVIEAAMLCDKVGITVALLTAAL
jgi:hypothetical protein